MQLVREMNLYICKQTVTDLVREGGRIIPLATILILCLIDIKKARY